MTDKEFSEKVFPNINKNIDYYISKYPARDLEKSKIVTRFAPSPTGHLHLGSLYSSFISILYARQTDGVVFLRIEDTDLKREVKNAANQIVKDLNDFSLTFDEGFSFGGNYGPYKQSDRKEIYQAFAKELIEKGLAYPCFCSEDSLDNIRNIQEKKKERIGYYGKWAVCRNLTKEKALEKIANKESYTIRLKSPGDFNNKIIHEDLIKGSIEFPENDLDVVLLKSDLTPMYHFAHLVDDFLMRTTHVIRGDEWLSSVPLHLQLFDIFNFKRLKYAHLAPIVKNDNGNKRKISKRLDKEAAISYYHELGIPKEALKLYLATLTNSNFEEWFLINPSKSYQEFEFSFNKMNNSGALFDMEKLLNISTTYISMLKSEEIYNQLVQYYNEYDLDFAKLMENQKQKTLNILSIERYIPRPRKDIKIYSDFKNLNWFLYDELFYQKENYLEKKEYSIDPKILFDYIENYYNQNDERSDWFDKIKQLSLKHGYSQNTKDYKNNLGLYKGHVGNISEFIRYSLTSQKQTPDLYEVLKIFTKEEIIKRFKSFNNK